MNNLVRVLTILFVFNPIFLAQNQSSIEKLSKNADLIITGKVLQQKSEWTKDRAKIVTRVIVDVNESIKAVVNQEEVTITHFGGEVGEIGELYSHTPKFINSEEVLLFLKQDQDNTYRVLYGEEGKLTLYEDKESGEKVTSSNMKISSIKNEIKKYIDVE